MKRFMAVTCLMVFCLTLFCWAADEEVSFSGTWALDAKKSDAFPQTLGSVGMGGFGGGFGGPGGRGGQTPPPPQPWVIEHSGINIRITNPNGMMGKPTVEEYRLDGIEVSEMVPYQAQMGFGGFGGGMGGRGGQPQAKPDTPTQVKKTTQATLKKNKIQIKMVTFNPNGKGKVNKEFELSKDGKKLTLMTKTEDPGMAMQGMAAQARLTQQKQVFNKQ